MAHTYRISFRFGELSFEIESSDKTWIQKKEKEYLDRLPLGTGQKIKPISPTSDTKPFQLAPGLTINEFFKKYIKSQKLSRSEIGVFFVYYLQRVRKAESIKTGDVGQCFAEVGYPKFNTLNYIDILYQAKMKALLNFVNSLWSLTITGEDFVLNTMSGTKK